VNNLVSLLLLFSLVGGSLILFDYDDIFAQSTDFQLPSLSFSTPYSDMPSNMGGSLSELGNIDEEVDSQVKEIIKPTFQNPLEKFATKEKDEILQQFKSGDFDILVATPVVEVGIDIPNATIIMIEAAERFGLAQLHQLRGRVGRSDKQSYCLLFTSNLNAETSTRLKSMETSHSGAELAELDLKLRGPGNLYGTAQHGIPKLKAANFSDAMLIQRAKLSADEIYDELNKYPHLNEQLDKTISSNISPD